MKSKKGILKNKQDIKFKNEFIFVTFLVLIINIFLLYKILNSTYKITELVNELNNTNQNLLLLKISGSRSDVKKFFRKKIASPKFGKLVS